jgi:small GTP-binding protein
MVVVMGERWFSCTDADGKPRLEDPEDLVRREVVVALERGIPLFPVLAPGARFPVADELPEALRGLCRLHALELTERSFPHDVDCLVEAISACLPSPAPGREKFTGIRKKVCMAGAFGVGKTSLVRRFVESMFDDRYLTTVGVKVDMKAVTVEGQRVMLALWDLAGEDEIAPVRMSHFRGANGYILVADGLRSGTLEKARELQRRVEEAEGMLPFVLAVNKSDRRSEWQVSDKMIGELFHSSAVLETSAKNGRGVEEMFRAVARNVLRNREIE